MGAKYWQNFSQYLNKYNSSVTIVSVETAPSSKDFTRFWSDSVTGISLMETISSYFLQDNRHNNRQTISTNVLMFSDLVFFNLDISWSHVPFQIERSRNHVKNISQRSLRKSIIQWDSQLISKFVIQPINQSINQSINQPASQPASQPVSQPASQSASQPASQSASQPVSQSVSQSFAPTKG